MPVPTLVPDPQVLLEMQPEELEGSFCRSCARVSGVAAGSRISGSAATTSGSTTQSRATHRTSGQGCSELLWKAGRGSRRRGFLRLEPEQEGWYFITRNGARYPSTADLRTYREASRFPRVRYELFASHGGT
jgi:hypothetical protein